jgi:hypothetical protein
MLSTQAGICVAPALSDCYASLQCLNVYLGFLLILSGQRPVARFSGEILTPSQASLVVPDHGERQCERLH